MEDKCDYVKLYRLGKYGLCRELLKEHNPKTEIDACILTNNRIVCAALLQKFDSKGLNEETWREVLYSFIDLHAAYRCLTKIPLAVELNIVYNLIWWYSSKLWNFKQNDVFETTVLEVVSQALMRVLTACKDISIMSDFEIIDMNFMVTLLKKTSPHMLSLTPAETIQMLDIYMMFSHLVLKKQDQKLSGECMEVLDSIVRNIEIIKLHITSHGIKKDYDEGSFKFGLSCINSSSSVDNYQSSLEAFMISVSILGSCKNSYRTGLKYLCQSEICGNTEAYRYLWNYFKAFCHMKLDEYNEAELHLLYISHLPMDNQRKFYYFLLLGSLYSHRQQHEEAMKEFHNALETGYNISSALMLTIMELQALSQPVMQLILLEKLVEDLSSKSEHEELYLKLGTLEDRCLTSMYKEFQVILPEALYIFARHAYITEHYSLSLELYLNLLNSIKGGSLLEYSRERRLVPLPSTTVITHEAILAHLECGNVIDAEKLCIKAIDDYFPSGGHSKEQARKNKFTDLSVDGILFSMEDDVFARIFLADIKMRQQNYSSANDYLDRCISTINRHQVLQKRSDINSYDINEIFLKYLLGRIYLRKARISEINNEVNNTYHYYKRAIIHAPGDDEILKKYKSWMVRNNRDDSVTLKSENNFPFAELENITVRYMLTHPIDKNMPTNIEETCVKVEEELSKWLSNKEENFIADVGDLFDEEIL